MYNTEETFMGARLPHTELSDSQMGVQAHAGIRFELPEPPRISPEQLERLKTESVNNPDAILNFLKESEAARVQYYKDITAIMEKQVNTISEQAESAKRQADAAIAISKKKDLPGCISAGVAVISVIINLIVCRAEVWDLIQQILR
ncbi:hypothetical protein DW020_08235 [Clostridium sp. AF37-5AT]|nr:hypothetical protein [Clostridium sp. AF37-5AT]RHO95575.1 hypothetical protein DW020_08235 [Clostridium sp. AF37-5AT]